MPLSAAEMSHAVFQPTIPAGLEKYTCTSHMLTLLTALDGSENLAAIAKKSGLPLKDALLATSHLMKANLITIVDGAGQHLDGAFFQELKAELSIAVGPIAEIIIEDSIRDLGHSMDAFPAYQAAELVELLAQEIQKENLRVDFQQKMLASLQKK
ncbi:hypothetical protein [Desulfosarcina variabilis]|uniref:hypothetical protein n=1 Tax=Desulfosarcina variabilis TaxID=2300 RepID=UPI003AFB2049